MKKLIAVVALWAFLPSCSTNMIQVEAIADTIALISERHDAYVIADETLADGDRASYLLDTELLQAVIEEAQK